MKTTMRLTFILVLALAGASVIAMAQTTTLATTRTTDATDSELLTATAEPSSTTEAITTPPPLAESTSSSTVNERDDQPVTSTVDSLSVNMDETTMSKATDNPEDSTAATAASTTTPAASERIVSTEGGDAEATTEPEESGIEPKSAPDGSSSSDKPVKKGGRFPKRLNLTHIDYVYTSSFKSEPEVVESWRDMGRKMRRGIGAVISSMMPMALNMSQEARIGSNCTGAMLKWVLSMNSLKLWALKMLDASGKPIAGLLEGSMTMFGNHRQCLKIRAPDDDEIEFTGEFREFFRGKYCIIQAKPWLPDKRKFYNFNTKIKSLVENPEEVPWYDKTAIDELTEWALAFNFVNMRMDLCMPSLCSREDIQKAINFFTEGLDMRIRVLRCETEADTGPLKTHIESGDLTFAGASTLAGSETIVSYGWFFAPFLVICLVLVATVASVTIDDDTETINKLRHTIKSFSLKRSVSSHMKVDYGLLADDKPLALYGIRFILVLWVITVESAVNLRFEFLRELLVLKDLIFWWPLQIVINSTLQFDSFILLAAFTMAYKNCLNESISNARAFIRYVLDKYIRLMPSVMLAVACMIILPRLYSGPVWNDYMLTQSKVCQSNGWLNSVFLQNYLPYKEICLPNTWLLCVEFQLIVLVAPVVYFLNKSYVSNMERQALVQAPTVAHKAGQATLASKSRLSARNDASRTFYWLYTLPGAVLAACVLLGWAASFYNVYSNQLPPSWFYTMADPDSKSAYFTQHLTKLWAHLAVFALGVLAGVECRRANRNRMRGRRGANLVSSLDAAGAKHYKGFSSTSSALSSSPAASHKDSMSSIAEKLKRANDYSNSIGGSGISINISHPTGESDGTGYQIGGHEATNTSGSRAGLVKHIFCCLLAITTMTLIIFSTHSWSINDLPDPLIAGLFDASSRLLWSMALIWLLYTVSVPRSSARELPLAARLLGAPIMVSLGKLSFLIYIIYPLVHTTVLAIQEQPIYSSWLMLFHILVGNVTLTVILASLASIFIEMPCRNLFRRCETSLLLIHSTVATSSAASTATTGTGTMAGSPTSVGLLR